MMQISSQGRAHIASFEGFRSKAYKCPGQVLTIGFGFTMRSPAFRDYWLRTRGHALQPTDTLGKEEAEELLLTLLDADYGPPVREFFGETIAQHHYDMALSVVYNCGSAALRWRWAKSLKAGDIRSAANYLRTTAITAKGQRLAGLVRRRKAEARIILEGYSQHKKDNDNKSRIRETRSSSKLADERYIRRGMKGEAIRDLQSKLTRLGFSPGKIDGHFGPLTEQALLAFQKEQNLIIDGRVSAGGKTTEALEKALDSQWQRPLEKARTQAKRSDLPDSRIINAANRSGGLITLGGLSSLFALVGEQLNVSFIDTIKATLAPLHLFGFDWLHGVLVAALIYLWWQARLMASARLDDHRKGKTL